VAAEDFPALQFVDAEVKTAIDVLNRYADSLDTKAGLCLGVAGVLAGLLLRAGATVGLSAYVAVSIDFAFAAVSLLGYRVRTKALLGASNLGAYIETDETAVRLAVLDTRLQVYVEANEELRRKSNLVNAALTGLLLAVMVTAIAAGQAIGGGHDGT
jgi:hypothetical protein